MTSGALAQNPHLELVDVLVRYDDRTVLDNVTLSTCERRIGIVGRNGSGKSTLARVIAGLVVPNSGTARLNSRDMARERGVAIRTVGILFQNPDHQIIFPTVGEELAFGLRQLGHSAASVKAEVRQILSDFGKAHWHEAATHSLSQGQKQLVCLMAVLVMRPALIVLDEPFAGLDIPTRMQLMRHFDRLDQAIVQITHDPAHLTQYDRVLWLDDAKIVADGPAAPVLKAFSDKMYEWGREDDLSDLTR